MHTKKNLSSHSSVMNSARMACKKIAPLWSLHHFVAVNPFVGLSDLSFLEACELTLKTAPGGMQMPLDFYRQKYESGLITDADIKNALHHATSSLGPANSLFNIDAVKKHLNQPHDARLQKLISTVADAIDATKGTQWAYAVTETISQFCSEYYDHHQSAWRLPWQHLPLYHAWQKKARINLNAEMIGLRGFRKWVKQLPQDPEAAIYHLTHRLGIQQDQMTDYFHRQLMTIRGWAGHIQYQVREHGIHGQSDDSLLDLLAIRLAYDVAILDQFDGEELRKAWSPQQSSQPSDDVILNYIWQLAHEHAWQTQFIHQLSKKPDPVSPFRPNVQAVFCIDVRSEVFRRALESTCTNIETIGFAGFFGMPIEAIPFGSHQGQSHCPVLLTPKFRIKENLRNASLDSIQQAWKRQRLVKRLSFSWDSFKTSAISCFSFVETAGVIFGYKLFKSAFLIDQKSSHSSHHHCSCGPDITPSTNPVAGIQLEDRITLAMGALRHMGLRDGFARIVLICGHGSSTTNNPYASSLDCGACGGHAGDVNARVAATILNDIAVRNALIHHGINIPDDTIFIAALHHTTTDEVSLFELNEIPNSHTSDVRELTEHLNEAGKIARKERATLLGLDNQSSRLDLSMMARSNDWAQVRPEWGLAGNAAFIAAPRKRTQHSNFNGRVFLHNYHHQTDDQDATLELIMIAPMVVANWINLQYYASTVNPTIYGSGNKITHNIVSSIGVCQGNGGDIQTGLPIQSIHDGEKWIHEPIRLHVMIEAPRKRIQAIIEKHENIKELITHEWLLLFAIEDDGASFYKFLPTMQWKLQS